MNGIEANAFHMLVQKNPQTGADVIQLCHSYDKLRKLSYDKLRRVSTRRSNFDMTGISALTIRNDSCDHSFLPQQIQQFFRKEVAWQLSFVPSIPEPTQLLAPLLRHIIQQQFSEALPIA